MKSLAVFLLIASLCILNAQSNSELKNYLQFKQKLAKHCHPKNQLRGLYASKENKEALVLEFKCTKGLALHWNTSLSLSFITNNSEAWVLYPAQTIKFESEKQDTAAAQKYTMVEHYKNPQTKWPSLWLQLFKKSLVIQTEDKAVSEEYSKNYTLAFEENGGNESFAVKSKNSILPSFTLNYTPNAKLPSEIKISSSEVGVEETLSLSNEKEIENPSNRSFAPDVSASKLIKEIN